ncbi:MAG TPA: helix-turn-helix domain-containing protein [Candidatus Nanoarchaeia archaeon]|nr:helix-turn-helix domain-containing protein [Candidatus Nanoarchaeia archaeon]
MIVQKDFLNKLKDFGLNSYEAKLWTALLSRGVATAGELSDIANVPRSRSYDVLESLERKGFVIMKLGKPIKYIAVPPAEVLERVKKSISEDAERQEKIIESLKESEVLSELNLLHKSGIELVEPGDLTGAVRGRTNLYNHILSAIKNAEKSVCIMTTDSGLVRKAEVLKNAFQKAKERGVRIRIVSPQPKNAQPLKNLSNVAQVKHVPTVPARFCVVDGKQVTFMVLDDTSTHPNYDFGVWVSAEPFAKSFENIFNIVWDKK